MKVFYLSRRVSKFLTAGFTVSRLCCMGFSVFGNVAPSDERSSLDGTGATACGSCQFVNKSRANTEIGTAMSDDRISCMP